MNRYLILTTRKPEFNPSCLPDHYAYLDDLRKQDRVELAGGFSDKTGGAYILRAKDMEEAKNIVSGDPVHTTNSSLVTVHEWNAK